jgi:hypothetical protein
LKLTFNIQYIRHIITKDPSALHLPGRCVPITGAKVVLCIGEMSSGKTGDVDLDFGRDVSPGVRSTASPRSTDTYRSASGTVRLLYFSGRPETFVSSPSSPGGGGSGRGTKLCEVSIGWTRREDVILAFDLKQRPLATYI